jgi:2,3,4,5-tetrahydropyridine-2-carboxylate N-succinyltransferase
MIFPQESIERIENAFVDRSQLKSPEVIEAIENAINALDRGDVRVASFDGNRWITREWVKKAILLSFAIREMKTFEVGPFCFKDKIPLKSADSLRGVRVVPGGIVRHGAFVDQGAVLMPSFVNIGAYVGEGTMVDTWATVGSCAQVGARVHLSGGVGIGGVLEPPQAQPVIIEDDCFIGSRAIVVEGVHIGRRAVLGANTVITASTKILDVSGSREVEHKGYVPEDSVVIPGTRMKDFPAGSFGVPVALIIGKRKPSTDLKVSLNEALRDFQISV